MASSDLRDELICFICLNVYTDPATLSCGHNFCRACIDHVLDTQAGCAGYSCPDCRTRFTGRPVLLGNITLRNIAQRFQSTQPQENSGVTCTHCIHAPVPAVKSCLHCEASLCPDHLTVHSKSPEHVLCDPSTALKSRKCSVHKKILEYYCSEESALICVSCIVEGEHREHHVEPLDKASEKKRRQLFQLLQELKSQTSEMEKTFDSLKERKESIHNKAAYVSVKITTMFGDIRRQLKDLENRVLMVISRQEEHESRTVSDQIRQLETKKDKMSKKIQCIEELCHKTDPVTVLQEQLPCASDPGDQEDDSMEDLSNDGQSHEEEDLCMDPISNTLHTLSDIIRGVKLGFYIPQPTDIILDINTAGDHINISNNLKSAAYSESENNLPKTSERFNTNQVLSRQSFLSGVHYWDMEGSGLGMWRVGVCYPSIDRGDTSSVIGDTDRSWALEYFVGEYSAIHNGEENNISQDISRPRLRISLDYEAGQVSFYQLSEPTKHLHTFTATFTEPLHAAFWLGWDVIHKDSWVKIEDLNI